MFDFFAGASPGALAVGAGCRSAQWPRWPMACFVLAG